MTKKEFLAWALHTERSTKGWQVDECQLHNHGLILMYHGGESGTFVWIENKTVTVGKYEFAVPHIGEALFTPTGSRSFPTEDKAHTAVANATGISGVMALLTGDGRAPYDAHSQDLELERRYLEEMNNDA